MKRVAKNDLRDLAHVFLRWTTFDENGEVENVEEKICRVDIYNDKHLYKYMQITEMENSAWQLYLHDFDDECRWPRRRSDQELSEIIELFYIPNEQGILPLEKCPACKQDGILVAPNSSVRKEHWEFACGSTTLPSEEGVSEMPSFHQSEYCRGYAEGQRRLQTPSKYI